MRSSSLNNSSYHSSRKTFNPSLSADSDPLKTHNVKEKNSPSPTSIYHVLKRMRKRRKYDILNPTTQPILAPFVDDHRLKTLDGVVSFTHYVFPMMFGKKSKHVILCGDVHSNMVVEDDTGQYLLDWVTSVLLKHKNRCIDLFLEHPRATRGYSELALPDYPSATQGPMFGATLKYIPLVKKIKNIRVHNIDLRYRRLENPPPTLIRDYINVYNPPFKSADIMKAYYAAYIYILYDILVVSKKIWEEWMNVLNRISFIEITRNYLKMFHPVRDRILKQLKNSIFNNNIKKFFKVLYLSALKKKIDYSITDIRVLNADASLLTIDAYALSRIFRRFDRGGRFKLPCSKYMPYCIVYVGDFHVSVYSKFIELYFGTRAIKNIELRDEKTKRIRFKHPFVIKS